MSTRLLSVEFLTSLSTNGGVRISLPSTCCTPNVVILSQRLQLVDWTLTPINISSYFLAFFFRLLHTYVWLSNIRLLSFAKMETVRQRASVRASTTAHKQKEKEGAATLAPKVIGKGTSKWKNEEKDNYPLKKRPSTPVGDKQSKQLSPPKPSHAVGKGLMRLQVPSPRESFVIFLHIRNISLRWLSQSSRIWTWTLVPSKQLKT